MSVLQAIELDQEWIQKADSGQKLITVRKGKRDYKQGRLILASPKYNWCKEVTCIKVEHIALNKISDELAEADGFANTKELRNKLSEYYGVVPEDTIMTVVKWELIPQALNTKETILDNKTLQAGEIIHGLGNSIVDGKSKIGSLTIVDGKILQELGHALRIKLTPNGFKSYFKECINHGFNPNESTHEFILEVLSRFIGNEGLLTFKQSLACEMNRPITTKK